MYENLVALTGIERAGRQRWPQPIVLSLVVSVLVVTRDTGNSGYGFATWSPGGHLRRQKPNVIRTLQTDSQMDFALMIRELALGFRRDASRVESLWCTIAGSKAKDLSRAGSFRIHDRASRREGRYTSWWAGNTVSQRVFCATQSMTELRSGVP